MNKNRIVLIVGLLSVSLVAMAVARPFSNTATAVESSGLSANDLSDYYQRQAEMNASAGASDFYQRHPDWASVQQAVIPVMSSAEASDYFQRHTELIAPAGVAVDVTDYFLRHPQLSAAADTIDLSDYFLRH